MQWHDFKHADGGHIGVIVIASRRSLRIAMEARGDLDLWYDLYQRLRSINRCEKKHAMTFDLR
jgi:hypothetical protein